MSPSQARAAIRRAQSQQKQAVRKAQRAVDDYNRKARAHNAKVKKGISDYNRAVDRYNRDVRAHNARRREAVNRYNRAVRELQRRPAEVQTATRTTHIGSVHRLQESFERFESTDAARTHPDLLDLTEREAANSAEAMTALLEAPDWGDTDRDTEVEALRATTITTELSDFSSDLDGRWKGALFALHPENPDAARHFCTSARETVSSLLVLAAPDDAVKSANPDYIKTPNGDVSRRARVHHCVAMHMDEPDELVDFVEADIDNLVDLFDDFNTGTHGSSGRFPLPELAALKVRVEDAIKFVHRLTRA